MNPRCPELQALRLVRFFQMMPWPEGWGLTKLDGQWQLLPIPADARKGEHD